MNETKGGATVNNLSSPGSTTTTWYDHLSPKERATKGLALFNLLPNTFTFTAAQKQAFKNNPNTNTIATGRFKQQRINFLIKAALTGNAHQVERILQEGAHINARNGYGQTAYFCACWQGQQACMQLLLQFGADLNIPSNGNCLPRDVVPHAGTNHGTGTNNTGAPIVVRPPVVLLPKVPSCFHTSFNLNESLLQQLEDKFNLFQGQGERESAAAFSSKKNAKNAKNAENTNSVSSEPHGERHTDPERRWFCDEESLVSAALVQALVSSGVVAAQTIAIVPYMRFLYYDEPGQQLLPHTDAAKYGVQSNTKSTHTWIVYLSECHDGGATQFVQDITSAPPTVLASCSPCRGRLLIFPHATPHAGAVTGTSPKLLLRGELIWEGKEGVAVADACSI